MITTIVQKLPYFGPFSQIPNTRKYPQKWGFPKIPVNPSSYRTVSKHSVYKSRYEPRTLCDFIFFSENSSCCVRLLKCVIFDRSNLEEWHLWEFCLEYCQEYTEKMSCFAVEKYGHTIQNIRLGSRENLKKLSQISLKLCMITHICLHVFCT